MAEYEDDDPTREEGPVIVKRAVHDAALRFEKTMGPGAPGAIGEAQGRAEKSRDAGKARTAARWWAIYRYLMTRAGAAKGTRTVILEAGESYDFERGRKIKLRAGHPRTGKSGR